DSAQPTHGWTDKGNPGSLQASLTVFTGWSDPVWCKANASKNVEAAPRGPVRASAGPGSFTSERPARVQVNLETELSLSPCADANLCKQVPKPVNMVAGKGPCRAVRPKVPGKCGGPTLKESFRGGEGTEDGAGNRQVLQAVKAGNAALQKARAMMPAVNAKPQCSIAIQAIRGMRSGLGQSETRHESAFVGFVQPSALHACIQPEFTATGEPSVNGGCCVRFVAQMRSSSIACRVRAALTLTPTYPEFELLVTGCRDGKVISGRVQAWLGAAALPVPLDDSGVICCAVEPTSGGEGPPVDKLLCRICLLEGPGEDDPLIAPCQCKGSIEYVHLGCLRHWIRGRLNLSDRPLGSYFYRPLTCELCKSVYPTYIHTNSGQERSPLVEVPFTQPPFIVLENMVRDSQQHTSRGLHVISLAEKELKLGRGHESDVRIADVSISRTHATIRFSKGHFLLQDSSSKFGTLVAMKKPRVLEPGVNISIQMGRTVLTLCAQHDPNQSNSASSLNQLPVGGSAQDERALRLSLLTRGQSEGGQSGGQTAQSEELPEE
ncbi:Marchf7, partial [Symbiodinium microadriaticum]